jgi:predicted hotdog family 3-hydroxylacyl-ACP dehydratase
MQETLPPIETLLSHRGNMLLLGSVSAYDEQHVVCHAQPDERAWYADKSGAMPAWIGIELMAQAIAAHVALSARAAGLPPRPGALLGTRAYHSVVASFPQAQTLSIEARLNFRDDTGLGSYACRIMTHEGSELASALLTVYEPADFVQFIQQGSGS